MSIFLLGGWVEAIFNTIWLSVCSVLYIFINWLYQVFETVANVNLFSEEVFKEITGRVYIIMGIAMLFIFAYNIILMIVNPDDKKSTGSTTKLVKDTIISLVVIVLLPTIFNYMYVFQGHVLSSNIIGQIIMGGTGNTGSNCDPDDYECNCDFSAFDELRNYSTGRDQSILVSGWTEGSTDVLQSLVDACHKYRNELTDSQRGAYSIAPTIFSAFYRPGRYDMDACEEYLLTGTSTRLNASDSGETKVCANFYYDIKMSTYTGNIDAFVNDSYLKLVVSDGYDLVKFDWLFAIVAGGLAVWMFLCYAMDVGVRVAKLGVLQIISPIAVMMRIIPSKGGGENQMYAKWFEELKTTYFDVFLRLVIIFFSLFAISLVPDVVTTLFKSAFAGETNWFIQTLSLVIVILGILKFAQEAPELLKSFFGAAFGSGGKGRFSIKPSDQKSLKGLAGATGTMGAIAGKNVYDTARNVKDKGLWGATKDAVRGLPRAVGQQFGGAYRGYKNGSDSKGFDGMRDSIYSSAVETMSSPTLFGKDGKIAGFYQANRNAAVGFYSGEYSPYNSKVELEKAEKLDKVASSLKKIEELLDKSNEVMANEQYYDGLRKAIREGLQYSFVYEGKEYKSGDGKDMRKTLAALEAQYKIDKGEARGKAYGKKKNDEAVKAAIGAYKEALRNNLAIVNDALKANGKSAVDIQVNFDDNFIQSNYTEFRDAGDISGKRAELIRQQAIEVKAKADKK